MEEFGDRCLRAVGESGAGLCRLELSGVSGSLSDNGLLSAINPKSAASMETLVVSGQHEGALPLVTDASVARLLRAAAGSLQTLSLDGTAVSTVGMARALNASAGGAAAGSTPGAAGAALEAPALTLPTLHTLDLRYCASLSSSSQGQPGGETGLTALLRQCPSLKCLHLSNPPSQDVVAAVTSCKGQCQGQRAPPQEESAPSSTLDVLTLAACGAFLSDSASLASVLPAHTFANLRILSLDGCSGLASLSLVDLVVGEAAEGADEEAVPPQPPVFSLPALQDLSCAGCAALTSVDVRHGRLRQLDFGMCGQLAQLDLACPELGKMNVAWCDLLAFDSGTQWLVPKLLMLDAQNTGINVRNISALASGCPQLSSVDVSGCQRVVCNEEEQSIAVGLQEKYPDLFLDQF